MFFFLYNFKLYNGHCRFESVVSLLCTTKYRTSYKCQAKQQNPDKQTKTNIENAETIQKRKCRPFRLAVGENSRLIFEIAWCYILQ